MQRDTNLRFVILTTVISAGFSACGCAPAHFGTYPNGLADFPARPISPAEAVEAAEPYLDQSFELLRAERTLNSSNSEPRIRVKLEGNAYWILKDNYISMNAGYGFDHAVKVDARTGEVTPPK
jgi:hypothetical protein